MKLRLYLFAFILSAAFLGCGPPTSDLIFTGAPGTAGARLVLDGHALGTIAATDTVGGNPSWPFFKLITVPRGAHRVEVTLAGGSSMVHELAEGEYVSVRIGRDSISVAIDP